MIGPFVVQCIFAAFGVAAAVFTFRYSGRLLARWFVSAWEQTAAQMYLKMLPKWFSWTKLYIFSCTGYFNRARNALYICFAASFLTITSCIFMLFFDGWVMVLAGLSLALSLFTMAECRVFDFARGTDGHSYPIFDRYAPLKTRERQKIRREKYGTRFTRVFGLFQKEVPLTDEDDGA